MSHRLRVHKSISVFAIALSLVSSSILFNPIYSANATLSVQSDFNGDGFADLAIGVSDENVGSTIDAGAVNVIYGSASGLTDTSNQIWTQESVDILDSSEANDHFGRSIANGDFNADGYSDLAIGVPDEDLTISNIIVNNTGAVNVIYGSASGLTSIGNQLWSQSNSGITTSFPNNNDDLFGWALTANDFNNDGYEDLAIGIPGKDVKTASSGAVEILYGSASGLVGTGGQFWSQDGKMLDDPEFSDFFGRALTSGDFNSDSYSDLAIGVPYEDISKVTSSGTITKSNAGGVNVMYGSSLGLAITGNQFWNQNSSGIKDYTESDDEFGYSLALGDFNNDGFDDLAIGVPQETIGTTLTNAGAVHIIYGSANRLTSSANQFWNQNTGGILGTSQVNDLFGLSITTGDFNADGYSDLAVGVPNDTINNLLGAGAVNTIYGSATGLIATNNQLWSQDSTDILDTSESADNFGFVLVAGDFNNNGSADLAIGVPLEDVPTGTGTNISNAGSVNVIYGTSSRLAALGNQFWSQNSGTVADSAESGDHLGSSLAAAGESTNLLTI